MKKIILILLFVFVTFAVYAKNNSNLTDGHLNGRFWNLMEDSERSVFLSGLEEGKEIMAEGIRLSKGWKKYLNDFFPKLTTGDIKSKLDKIYMEEYNRNIPIYMAYIGICFEFKETTGAFKPLPGKSLFGELRKKYNK